MKAEDPEASILVMSANWPFFLPYTFRFGTATFPSVVGFLLSSTAVVDMVLSFSRCSLSLFTSCVERYSIVAGACLGLSVEVSPDMLAMLIRLKGKGSFSFCYPWVPRLTR